jgi:hypothetical protein
MNPKERESYDRLELQLASFKEGECPCQSCGEPYRHERRNPDKA